MEKCISFSLEFSGVKFYICEIANAIGRESTKGEIQMPSGLREEIGLWRFLDSWDSHIPWRSKKHWASSVSIDTSMSRWAGVIHIQPNEIVLGDFWEASLVANGHKRLSS